MKVIKKIVLKIINFFSSIFSFLWKRKTYLIIILVILGITTYGLVKRAQNQAKKNVYTTDVVKKETIVETVSENGNVISENEASIFAPVNGTVEAVFVQNGQKVALGQPLFKIKNDPNETQQSQAYASYIQAVNNVTLANQSQEALTGQIRGAKKTLMDAKINYNNIKTAFDNGEINPLTGKVYSSAEVASAREAVFAAQANLNSLNNKYLQSEGSIGAAEEAQKAALSAYESTLTTLVNSPIYGTVSNLNLTSNQQVLVASLSSSAAGAPSPLMQVADLNKLQFQAEINEIDISKIQSKQTAQITFDAIKDKTYEGEIVRFDSIGTDNQGVVSYKVYSQFKNADDQIKLGMSGNISIEITKHENALTLPNTAIKPYKNGKAVQVFADPSHKTLKYIQVKTGIRSSSRTEILEGVSEGEVVVLNAPSSTQQNSLFGPPGGN